MFKFKMGAEVNTYDEIEFSELCRVSKVVVSNSTGTRPCVSFSIFRFVLEVSGRLPELLISWVAQEEDAVLGTKSRPFRKPVDGEPLSEYWG